MHAATDVCERSNCSHICLARPAHRGQFSCHCPGHSDVVFVLDKDERTCLPTDVKHGQYDTLVLFSV